MTRLERVIEAVKARRKASNSWIYDENHNIADNIICGDILLYLESLKGYEINVTDEYVKNFLKNKNTRNYYTYNWNANVSDDFAFRVLELDDMEIVAFCIHVGHDARVGFTDYFVCKFKNEHMFDIEGAIQHKWFGENGRYCADINIFSEMYDVWDSETEELTQHYTIELKDLLEELKGDDAA